MTSLAGKTALVTGASKGIGKAAALALAEAGANVVITYSSDDASAQAVVSSIISSSSTEAYKGIPPRALALKSDAGNVAQQEILVKQVVEVHGKIDILICNAGIMPLVDLEHTSEEAFDRVMGINVKGAFFLVQVSLFTLSCNLFSLSLYQIWICFKVWRYTDIVFRGRADSANNITSHHRKQHHTCHPLHISFSSPQPSMRHLR
jgi:short chain dehydrogenase